MWPFCRAGRLVELGTLDELRHLSAVSVDATFAGTPPDLSAVPGVSDVQARGHGVHLELRGPVSPLVRELATTDLTTLLSREPSLEELFLSHYDDAPPDVGADGRR